MADSGGTEELDIRWEDLDKSKFFFYGSTMFFGVRATLYPASLIKTRMQAASGEVYKSTWDAVKTIVRSEGPTGLYKGFWVSSFNLVFRQVYFTTFEVLREVVGPGSAAYGLLGPRYGELARNLAAGAGAQVVFQSFTVPLDVVTQRMMLAGAAGAPDGRARCGWRGASGRPTAGGASSGGTRPRSCSSRPTPRYFGLVMELFWGLPQSWLLCYGPRTMKTSKVKPNWKILVGRLDMASWLRGQVNSN